MGLAPPQGFSPGVIGTLDQIDKDEENRAVINESLMDDNNELLHTLLKQMELVTDEENIDGGKLADPC
jgi:hypothetical protein